MCETRQRKTMGSFGNFRSARALSHKVVIPFTQCKSQHHGFDPLHGMPRVSIRVNDVRFGFFRFNVFGGPESSRKHKNEISNL